MAKLNREHIAVCVLTCSTYAEAAKAAGISNATLEQELILDRISELEKRFVDEETSKAIFKRLYALNIKASDDVPDIAFITHEDEVWRVDEHYYSPRGNRYKQFTINAPDEYVAEARHIFIDDIDEWE